jgi:hypothetical protein
MTHNRDFEDLLSALSSARAEFLIVGAYAVMQYSEPRYTKDLDVWIGSTRANAKKVYRALKKFRAPLKNLKVSDLATPGIIFQIGIEPVRIDIITEVDGLDFDDAWRRRVTGRYGATAVAFLSVPDLIANKRAVGHPQDLLDVEKLRALTPSDAKTVNRKEKSRRRLKVPARPPRGQHRK